VNNVLINKKTSMLLGCNVCSLRECNGIQMRMLSKLEVKYIQSLSDKKSRSTHKQFIAEGPKIVADLLNEYPNQIVCLYATESWFKKNDNFSKSITTRLVELFELEKISALQTPQDVLAVVQMPGNELIPFQKEKWLLMLDGIQDPGNMGSIIRIADWFGIAAIYCTPGTADIYNPKVVQAAMGSLLRIPVCYGDFDEWIKQTEIPVYATLLEGENIYTAAPHKPGIVIIGNEGKGIRPSMLTRTTKPLTIPKKGKAESLNAAVATGIVLAQLVNRSSG
jgi:RNA methyltransferase, TrmH family